MYQKLIPFKIPSGWAVIYNSFGYEEPIIVNKRIINDEFYNEDLLSIELIKFNGDNWITDENNYTIDLGWYPEADPNGNYRLVLLKEDWDNIIVEIESKHHQKIANVIEQLFDLISQGVDDKQIKELIS